MECIENLVNSNWSVLKFLFQSYCMSFYGVEQWFDRKYTKEAFKPMRKAYHNCIKQMLHLPTWESNRHACHLAGLPIFKHFLNNKILSYLFSIINSKSPCLSPLLYYFKYDSHISYHTKLICQNEYNVGNVIENDIDALRVRIHVKQESERIA